MRGLLRTHLQLILHPRSTLQQANALLHREVAHGAIQSTVCEQATERLLALWAAAVFAQVSPLQDALGCKTVRV